MNHDLKSGRVKAIQSEKVRFGLVGVVNTAVDFVVLNLLVGVFHVPLMPANIASTTAALLTSFTLNKKAVFRDADGSGVKQLALFLAVTLTGIWLVQGTMLALAHAAFIRLGLPEAVALNLGKLAGISCGLVWNYLWYSKVVFRKQNHSQK